MATEYQFFLDDLEIEEPIGFSTIEFDVSRDDKMHGMQFEASTSALQFYGAAADYLTGKKNELGLRANVVFVVLFKCDVNTDYEEIIRGRLNFGKWKDTCGAQCMVSLPVESETCEVVLKNRFDQKVNIDTAVGFDGETVLPAYSGISAEKTIKAKELFVGTVGQVADGGYTFDFNNVSTSTNPTVTVRPIYARASSNSIDSGQVDQVTNEYGSEGAFDIPVSPVLLFEDNITCFSGDFVVSFRFKGSYNINIPNASILALRLQVVQTDDITSASPNQIDHYIFELPHSTFSASGSFDKTYSATINIQEGFGLYGVFAVASVGLSSGITGTLTWDEETSVSITANKACPDTSVELSLIHETLSRATEAITDYSIRVKSSYYGRTDSAPFSFDDDGCGGLRFLTSGLKIRRAAEDNFFVSLKELIDGLQAIDNIGIGVEEDPERDGGFLLRVEGLDFFYTEQEVLFHDSIPKADSEIEESKHYSKIVVGYKKWEVSRVNGLDEYNSNREYRTGLSSVSNTLDITSSLIAGSYPLEITRQQSFADTGGADTSYDNETFIITGQRNAYGVDPEQGNITDPLNIYSPETSFNFKLRPTTNLMRWYKTIINSYAGVTDSDSKLFFSSGTGNTVASGRVSPDSISGECIIENKDIAENEDIFISQFARVSDYTPLYKNETISYEYPMSIGDYRMIKQNPYGYIRYQCGNGPIEKGYIKQIKFKPGQGMASIVLKKKW